MRIRLGGIKTRPQVDYSRRGHRLMCALSASRASSIWGERMEKRSPVDGEPHPFSTNWRFAVSVLGGLVHPK